MFFNFTAVRYSLHKCSETIWWLKWQFTVHVSLVSCALKFTKARKTYHRVVSTSNWSILYSGERCNKNCIVKTSEMLIVWHVFCCTAVSGKSDAVEGVLDQLLKGAAMVFRVHSRHVELLLTYWCSQSMMAPQIRVSPSENVRFTNLCIIIIIIMIVSFEAAVCNNWMSCLN